MLILIPQISSHNIVVCGTYHTNIHKPQTQRERERKKKETSIDHPFSAMLNALKTRPLYALVFSSGSVHCCPIWMVFDIRWCWFSLQKRGPALYIWICGPPKVWQFQETGK